jgi:predicted SAM-dependent methyltransferase
MKNKIKLFLCTIAPWSFWIQAQFELRMLRVRLLKKRFRNLYADAQDLMINFGAGPTGRPGWINIDGGLGSGINCLCDGRSALPFSSESVRCVFTEHFFEHIDYYDDAPVFLAECHRILKPLGTIRIIVPDAGRYIKAYVSEGWDSLAELRQLGADKADSYFPIKFESKMELVNFIFRQGGEHKFAYDFESMRVSLKKAGFVNIEQVAYGVSRDPVLALDQQSREHESLYVEASKAA